jgi:aspartyl-tRNA(Asn)/glutamyl-tRNA(Gln) amidotransferase subunit A
MNLSTLTIKIAREMLDAKQITARQLTEAYLLKIDELNPELNAYLEVFTGTARAQAKKADEMIARGDIQPLTGIPIAVKDNICIEGKIASSGSKMLANYTASYNATVVEKLLAQGAVILGRTNMDEFALGSSTENSAFGPTKNPADMSRVPGGTSGGSAAAVAANMCLAALGSDTGGSVRQPAGFCGVVGLKPTYGAVSRYGLIAAASSLDQVGVLAKNTEDAGRVFAAIRGEDRQHDSTSLPTNFYTSAYRNEMHDRASGSDMSTKKRIAVPKKFLEKGFDADVLAQFYAALKKYEAAGYTLVDVDIPLLPKALATYYITNFAEVSSNLSRIDGIRYGYSKRDGKKVDGTDITNVTDIYEESRGTGYGREARRRIMLGTFVLSSGYSDAFYVKSQAVRELIRAQMSEVLETVDALVMPTTPTPAYKFGEHTDDPLTMYAGDICTVPANLCGIPGISVPMGTVERDGVQLPVGLQLLGIHGSEEVLLELGSVVVK